MGKVYLVYEMYHEHDHLYEEIYSSEIIQKIFDTQEKAIDYICEKIRLDHMEVDNKYPGDEHITKCYPDKDKIRQGDCVASYDYIGLEYISVNYRIVPYDVE